MELSPTTKLQFKIFWIFLFSGSSTHLVGAKISHSILLHSQGSFKYMDESLHTTTQRRKTIQINYSFWKVLQVRANSIFNLANHFP
jgi:hypothetical protein